MAYVSHVEVGLTDGTKLVVENASEDDVLQQLSRLSGPAGVAALNAREGMYRIFEGQVVYVRSVVTPT
jgi:hypothetical protein